MTTVPDARRPTIFVSYSHNDLKWKDSFIHHLRVLEAHGVLEVWDDSHIRGGDDWKHSITRVIERASIAILLISADFLSSPFILEEEVPSLLERRKRGGLVIIPVLMRPCAWEAVSWLASIQILPGTERAISEMPEHEAELQLSIIAKTIANIPAVSQATSRPRLLRRTFLLTLPVTFAAGSLMGAKSWWQGRHYAWVTNLLILGLAVTELAGAKLLEEGDHRSQIELGTYEGALAVIKQYNWEQDLTASVDDMARSGDVVPLDEFGRFRSKARARIEKDFGPEYVNAFEFAVNLSLFKNLFHTIIAKIKQKEPFDKTDADALSPAEWHGYFLHLHCDDGMFNDLKALVLGVISQLHEHIGDLDLQSAEQMANTLNHCAHRIQTRWVELRNN